MRAITIEVTDELGGHLETLVKLCTETNQRRDGATSHGPLTVPALLSMLAEDAGMLMTRPGCWEAANMATLLESHGYQF
jgi:hypothetical protein